MDRCGERRVEGARKPTAGAAERIDHMTIA